MERRNLRPGRGEGDRHEDALETKTRSFSCLSCRGKKRTRKKVSEAKVGREEGEKTGARPVKKDRGLTQGRVRNLS